MDVLVTIDRKCRAVVWEYGKTKRRRYKHNSAILSQTDAEKYAVRYAESITKHRAEVRGSYPINSDTWKITITEKPKGGDPNA